MIVRNKETKEYINVKNKYGYSTLDFQTAFLYVSKLSLDERKNVEIFSTEKNEIIEPKHYISNERFLLFLDKENINLKDYAMGKIKENLNVPYMKFIDDMVAEYEELMQKPILSNQNDFTDYMKVKILGNIAYEKAYNSIGSGTINSSSEMNNLLDKYNISKDTDLSLFNRISLRWQKGEEDRIRANFKEEIIDKIPEKYKHKYLSALNYDESKSSFENYYEETRFKEIIRNIDKIESNPSKLKFLVLFSENRVFEPNSVLSYDDFKYKTDRAIDKVEERNRADSEEYGEDFHTYDKTDFLIVLDYGDNIEISKRQRHDIGDYSSFEDFMNKVYKEHIPKIYETIQNFKDEKLEYINSEEDEEEEEEI